MCGSGTILVEAALIARCIAPGLMRSLDTEAAAAPAAAARGGVSRPARRTAAPLAPDAWPFQAWPDHAPEEWRRVVDEARGSIRPWDGRLVGVDSHEVRPCA